MTQDEGAGKRRIRTILVSQGKYETVLILRNLR